MTTVVPDRKGRRRLNRYLRAAEAKAFEGTIPYTSDDPDEQDLLDATHDQIDRELERARGLMLAHLDEQALTIVDLQEQLAALRLRVVTFEEAGTRALEAVDKYNEENDTALCGGALVGLAKAVGSARNDISRNK